LNKGQEPTDFKFLNSPAKIAKMIAEKKPTTQRTYYIAICSLLANGIGPKKLYEKYYAILTQMNKDLSNRTTKSETQKENWLTPDEIEKVHVNLEKEVKNIRVNHVTKKEFNTVLSFMVLSLFTKTAPRRNVDYTLMKVSSNMTDTKFNYLDIANKKMIFNNYKTQKKYNQVVIDIPDVLGEVIAKYMKFHPEKNKLKNKKHDIYFLVNHDGNNLSNSNDVTKILNNAFGQKVGSSLLRNMFLTHKYGDIIEDLKEDTQAMSTSVGVAMTNYIKEV
jgi:hypothetical protein